MASIDGRDVLTMTGAASLGTAERVQDITRPHVHGIAFRKTGKRGRRVTIRTAVDLGSEAACETEFEAYTDMCGTLVDVEDVAGNTIANVMVHDVRRIRIKAHLGAVGGINGGDWLLQVRWELQATEYE